MESLKKGIRKTSNINALILLLFMVITLALSYIISYITIWITEEKAGDYSELITILGLAGQYLIVVPLILGIFRKKLNTPVSKFFCKSRMPSGWVTKWIIISIFLTYVTGYISNFLFTFIQEMSGIELHPIDFTLGGTIQYKALYFICLAVLAPFFEELLFRAMLFGNAKKYGRWSMVIIMGILFGLYHMNYEQILYATVLGICSCFLVAKTGSVYPSLIVHMVINTISAIQLVAVGGLDLDRVSAGDMTYYMQNYNKMLILGLLGMIILFILIAGGILFIGELINHRGSFRIFSEISDSPEMKSASELSGSRRALIYITAPVNVILFIVLITMTLLNAFNL